MAVEYGPCLWPDVTQLCCSEWDDYTTSVKEQAVTYAKTVLWAATGRQYGLCELTVRPCGRQCENCPSGWFWDDGGWWPYINSAGLWKNCWCGSGPGCSNCAPECQVYLPGPVYGISQVRLHGETLPVTGSYFVLDQQWLVRVDTTECWPLCDSHNLSLAPGDPNVFEVTFTRGRPVPDALANAAASLACEYAKACVGAPCRLPGRVQNISRQGISISMVDPNELLKSGMTGLWEVDMVIRSFNPMGVQSRARFWSPELQEGRQVTWP